MGKQQDIERMLRDIPTHTRYSSKTTGRDVLDSRVLNALAQVPRDAFVPQHLKNLAYSDGPLARARRFPNLSSWP